MKQPRKVHSAKCLTCHLEALEFEDKHKRDDWSKEHVHDTQHTVVLGWKMT